MKVHIKGCLNEIGRAREFKRMGMHAIEMIDGHVVDISPVFCEMGYAIADEDRKNCYETVVEHSVARVEDACHVDCGDRVEML